MSQCVRIIHNCNCYEYLNRSISFQFYHDKPLIWFSIASATFSSSLLCNILFSFGGGTRVAMETCILGLGFTKVPMHKTWKLILELSPHLVHAHSSQASASRPDLKKFNQGCVLRMHPTCITRAGEYKSQSRWGQGSYTEDTKM
eukprot:TRINITY_DN2945_c0_g1_i1.p1 TRINITY_DN2945_c0_g1~~TRINITY_DN2945_c0_g1_i1.p1  ORF type:complete len:144 (-),score=6.71 TRINITY_DN2945_c0_g1_i1:31-462(-)